MPANLKWRAFFHNGYYTLSHRFNSAANLELRPSRVAFLKVRLLAKVILGWVQSCRWRRSNWNARKTSFFDYDTSHSRYETPSFCGKYAQSKSVYEPSCGSSTFPWLSEDGIWISWKVSGSFHEVLPNPDIQHLPECEGVRQSRCHRPWTIENHACFHNWKLWRQFERFFGQRLLVLFGYDASFCRCNAVFGFFWTLNRLFADIHQ